MFGSQPYGYSWMTVNGVSFGIGQMDAEQSMVDGFACRLASNHAAGDDQVFQYKVYDDTNGDSQCQASEVLVQDSVAMPAGAEEVHIQEVAFKGSASKARVILSAHQKGKNLATYEGSLKF